VGRARRCGIELADRALSAGESAAYVTVGRNQQREGLFIQGRHSQAIGAGAARTPYIDLRASDPAGDLEALAAGIGAGNGASQGGNLLGEYGIEACGAAQAVA
jgi:hypothetical protein